MRIVQINAVPYGSTGRIMFQLADALKEAGHSVLCTAGFTWQRCRREDFFITSNLFEKTLHAYLARVTGRIGCFSRLATRRLLKRMDDFQPDLIHLHNLHCWFVNIPMLFDYIREHQIPVVWTLHDCWAFTGHCPHFDGIACDKWKTGCHDCPLYRQYPQTYVDHSRTMYSRKQEWFSRAPKLTVVTPSHWLRERVKESFLRERPVQVIHNGIDRSVFHPRAGDVRQNYGIADKYLVLGVAYAWDNKKGLDVFRELAGRLGEEYRILLVGTDETTERQLPDNIISVRRTESREKLAEIYSAADVFVNPTREDSFPTVNMEAIACGTPVVTFATGGSPEIPDENSGVVTAKEDIDAMETQIRRICREKPFSREACVRRGAEFDERKCVEQYLALYGSML